MPRGCVKLRWLHSVSLSFSVTLAVTLLRARYAGLVPHFALGCRSRA